MSETKAFELTVTGKAEIPHSAERAVINVSVSSQGLNKAAVSDEVITTAKHIESLLRQLSPTDSSAEAKAAAPLAHWNKTSLSFTSYVPTDNDGRELARNYKASVGFDIRFKEFKALGGFGARISSLPHVEVRKIEWILTTETEKSFHSQLRRDATVDAMEKARDYCDVLGCTNVKPVKLAEGLSFTSSGRMTSSNRRVQAPGNRASMQATQFAMGAYAPPSVGAPSESGTNVEFNDSDGQEMEFR